MAKCRCEESRVSDPRWRIKSHRPKGREQEYLLVCLSCEWEWWSSAKASSAFPHLSQEERQKLEFPSHSTKPSDLDLAQ
jgi:hypothetical protein